MKVLWKGPTDMSGYGRAGINYLKALVNSNIKVKYSRNNRSFNLAGKGIGKAEENFISHLERITVPSDSIYIQHNLPHLFDSYGLNAKIGYTVFEMRQIPQEWVAFCNKLDEIWTPSQYSKESFVNSGVNCEKIHVIPHVIDIESFKPGLEALNSPSNRRNFNFVSNFDFTSRKNWKLLLRAFWTAFNNYDDVTLCLKVFFLSFEKPHVKKLKEMISNYKKECGFSNTAPILLYPYPLSADLMPNFYNTFDCYVSVGREGFGIPFAEAMACELPSIGPEVGGNTYFMNPNNSLLVRFLGYSKVDEETVAREARFKGLEWAIYDFEDLVEKFRFAYDNPKTMKAIGKIARKTVENFLSYEVVGELMKRRLSKWED